MKEVESASDEVMMCEMVIWQHWMMFEVMVLGFEMEEEVVTSLETLTSFPVWVVFVFYWPTIWLEVRAKKTRQMTKMIRKLFFLFSFFLSCWIYL